MTWPWPWPLLSMAFTLIQYLRLTFECFGRVWACLSQVGGSENQNAETLNFDLWPDLDLTRDLDVCTWSAWVDLDVCTCAPIFPISGADQRIVLKCDAWLGTRYIMASARAQPFLSSQERLDSLCSKLFVLILPIVLPARSSPPIKASRR